jgi:OOP family OmpA-OmpF porin
MKSALKNIFVLLIFSLVSVIAQAAATAPNGYLADSEKDVVKSGYGLCWHTGSWTPADATVEGCDGKLAKAPVLPVTESKADSASTPAKAPASPAPAAAPAAAPAPAAATAAAPTSEKVTFEADALFAFDKAVLQPAGKAKLEDLVSKLQGTDIEVIIATGHTDWTGTDAYNQKLSMRRAAAVKAFLVSKGLPADRIFTEGKGEKQPVASNKTSDGRAQNRRVEVEVVGKRNK